MNYREDTAADTELRMAIEAAIETQARVIRLSKELEAAKKDRDIAAGREITARRAWAEAHGLGALVL